MRWLREFLKTVLPAPLVRWLRRWLATGRYIRFVSHEIYRRQARLEPDADSLETLEGRLAAGTPGFYDQMLKEVLERTDLVLQQLDRRLEGQAARHGHRLGELEEEVRRLQEAVEELRSSLGSAGQRARPPAAGTGAAHRSRTRSSDAE